METIFREQEAKNTAYERMLEQKAKTLTNHKYSNPGLIDMERMRAIKNYEDFKQLTHSEKTSIRKDFEEKNSHGFYIQKHGENFKYLGVICHLSKGAHWYKVFHELFKLAPQGGQVTYSELGKAIKTTIPTTKRFSPKEMIRFIQRNLTDKANGFMYYAKTNTIESNGKPLIYIKRAWGVIFNNSAH